MVGLTHRKIGLRSGWILGLLIGLLGLSAGADDMLPTKARVTILMTSLSYDHKLTTRSWDGVRLAVVGRAGHADSVREAEQTRAALNEISAKKIKGLPITVETVAITDVAHLRSAIASKRANVIYLCSDLDDLLPDILLLAGRMKILTMTGMERYVGLGVAIGAVARDNKPKILVNLPSVLAQGARFDSRFLRLAEVVN